MNEQLKQTNKQTNKIKIRKFKQIYVDVRVQTTNGMIRVQFLW